jgi:tRNA A-37 threonylcarbamoyl transferase component Bud32
VNLGDLELLNLHASGGMAEVYRARVTGDDGLVREYAVKKILPQFTRDREILKMFIEEARVAAYLQHDCVVRVHDLCTSESGEYFIVMEFADGKDLSDVIWEASQKRQVIPMGMGVQAARDVLRALDYAWHAVDEHGAPLHLIHRDISPHNVLVTWDGRIKLTDFGIAKVAASANKTQMGIIKGKFGYMSPEQARGKPLDQRSDLFNVGIMLYEGFTGLRLFEGASDLDTLEAMRAARVPRLPSESGVPAELEAVMRQSLERDPDRRFQTARAFESALLQAAQRGAILIRPAETAATMKRLFPQLAVEPVVRGTRQLDLKSQLWQAPGVMVGGRAAVLPAQAVTPPPAAPVAQPKPPMKAAVGPLVSSSKGARSLEDDDDGARSTIKVGGSVRALSDIPQSPRAVRPAPSSGGFDANATRVEMAPSAPPPFRSPVVPLPLTSPEAERPLPPAVKTRDPQRMLAAPSPPPPHQPAPSPPPYQPAPSPPPYQPAPSPPPPPYQPAPPPAPPPYQPPPPPYQPAPSPAPPPYQPAPPPYQPAPPPPMALPALRGPPPPPVGMSPPPPPAGVSWSSAPGPAPPVGAEGASLADVVSGEGLSHLGSMVPAVSPSQVSAPVRRRSRWRLQVDDVLEHWLPMRARVLGGLMAMVGIGVGFVVAVTVASVWGRESSTQRSILIRSTPPGATVTIDDVRVPGVTPVVADLRLDDGPHAVKIGLAASAPAVRKIVLAAGDRSLTLSENLQSSGSVRVQTRPGGARILIDGRDVGTSPTTIDNVGTDKLHVVEARRAGYKDASAPVPVERPAEYLVSFSLEPNRSFGKVVLLTSLPATVELDGQPWGMTSTDERECPPGRHEVTVRVASLGIERRTAIEVPERGVARYFVGMD